LADETFRVVRVAPSSPGAQAGLSHGDVLIELDGRPAKEFTLEEVRQQIRIDGKRNLTVVREGKRVKLVMELAGRLDMPGARRARSSPPAAGPPRPPSLPTPPPSRSPTCASGPRWARCWRSEPSRRR